MVCTIAPSDRLRYTALIDLYLSHQSDEGSFTVRYALAMVMWHVRVNIGYHLSLCMLHLFYIFMILAGIYQGLEHAGMLWPEVALTVA